jgi:uncharacterized Zn-finger protein
MREPINQAAKLPAQVYKVRQSSLPLACPLPDQTLWNAHPRVFLVFDALGSATCPYCGNHFVLTE